MPNSNPHKFSGTGVALVTPFQSDFSIDFPRLGKIIDHVIAGGVDYVVSLGTTGEAITLSSEECLDVLRFTVDRVAGRVPIVAGYFGSNYTDKLVRAIGQFDFTGLAAIMSSSPAYSKPPQEGIYQHYLRIAEASPLPIIIYNVPSRTGSNVTPQTVLRLAHASDRFVAVKEASGNLGQAMEILKHRPPGFAVLSGEDPLTLPMMAAGGDGAISVIANVFPRHFSELTQAALRGDWAKARERNFQLLDVHPWLYCEGNPVGIKAAMAVRGHCEDVLRIPLVSLTEASRNHLAKAMAEVAE